MNDPNSGKRNPFGGRCTTKHVHFFDNFYGHQELPHRRGSIFLFIIITSSLLFLRAVFVVVVVAVVIVPLKSFSLICKIQFLF